MVCGMPSRFTMSSVIGFRNYESPLPDNTLHLLLKAFISSVIVPTNSNGVSALKIIQRKVIFMVIKWQENLPKTNGKNSAAYITQKVF